VKQSQTIPIDELNQPPYSSILCFPRPTEPELKSRIQELHGHGISALEFTGKANLFGVKLPVVGKGFVGIVVVAHKNGERLALKILRQDAGRADLLHEAEMLRLANAVDVAPKLVSASKNFLLMQLIEGELLPNWLQKTQDSARVKGVLREVLEQCWRLDMAGLDHGELSKAPKHVLVDGVAKPFLVDFETASNHRRPANVTAICQYLFSGNSSSAQSIAQTLGQKNQAILREALRHYKIERTRENFRVLLGEFVLV
jgi:putative serine/threonine protein kinase